MDCLKDDIHKKEVRNIDDIHKRGVRQLTGICGRRKHTAPTPNKRKRQGNVEWKLYLSASKMEWCHKF